MSRLPLGLLLALGLQDAPPDLSTVPPDLRTPPVATGDPGAGRRVRQTSPGYEGTSVHHALYLPRDWVPGRRWPVILEYAGNGNYRNAYGDVSEGTVEGSNLGYGISGGEGVIWVCLPFVRRTAESMDNAVTWWGDVEETVNYCRKTVEGVCQTYGGDPRRLVLAGFSRGAIACNYIGLHDDQIAPLWRAFVTFSHYDGETVTWGYPGADRASALVRLKRLRGRPQFISMEKSVDALKSYLDGTGIAAPFTYQAVRFRNHSDQWVLRDLPERKVLRDWFRKVLAD